MAVDLNGLVDSLKREVNPPGVDMFPDATDDDYVGHLQDAFWEARLDGMLAGFDETGASVTPVAVDGADLTRDLQQLVVLYAGVRIVRNDLRNMNTTFRAKAGAVEFETQKSAAVLRELLLELKARRNIVLTRLSDMGYVPSYYIDSLAAREQSLAYGDIGWVGS